MTRLRRVVVLVNASKRYDRRVVQGVAAYVRERGKWDLYVDEHPLQRLPNLHHWNGDGIVAGLDDHRVAAAVAGLKLPIVGIGGGKGWYDPASRVPYFATDNESIGRMAAEHLLACGFPRLAFYGDRWTRYHDWSQRRGEAFRERAQRADVPCFIYLGRRSNAHNWAKLQDDLAAWLASLEKPIGLLSCTDVRARQVLEACRMIGARVPDDVAVVGVDNDEIMCELASPPLSSIEQGSRRIGYQAAAMLDKLMAGKRPSRLRYVVPPECLIARQSTDVLACDDSDLVSALSFVREHACDPIHVSDVLEKVRLSRSTLEKKFQTLLGRSIHAEIQRVEIERAKDLLVHTTLLVKQVARRSGFKHVQYMTEVFRRHVGQSPAKYRKGHLH
jgi:LacI family transcriptional regulator